MKVLIRYQPKHNRETYEGVRLRKTLKGECELAGISWVSNAKTKPDIAHFISPRDLLLLRKMKRTGVKCIVSAFYCENDPYACFLNRKNPQNPIISKKALAICNEADLVLVPNEFFYDFAKNQKITSEIRVFSPSVDLSRFQVFPGEEKIFPRYFRVRPNQAVVIGSGSYGDNASVSRFKKIASLCPNIEFYFFGSGTGPLTVLWDKIGRLNRKATPNCHFVPAAHDDIYRSAIYRSIARLSLSDPAHESLGVLDAFAAKLQVVAYGDRPFSNWIKADVTAKVFQTEEQIAAYLEEFFQGKAEMTIMGGYQIAYERRIENGASKLKIIYESILNA